MFDFGLSHLSSLTVQICITRGTQRSHERNRDRQTKTKEKERITDKCVVKRAKEGGGWQLFDVYHPVNRKGHSNAEH